MVESNVANLQALLLKPREALDIEIKGWLELEDANQRAQLAKAVIAVANNGGGFVVIGLREDETGQFSVDPNRPTDLSKLRQDDVQDCVQKYLEPVIQCRVHHIEHPDQHDRFPIIVVPGGHRVPVKAKVGSPDGKLVKNRVYIRRPGPKSEEPQTAAEWDGLFERCIRARRDELLEAVRDLVSGQVPRLERTEQTTSDRLIGFVKQAEERWAECVGPLPDNASPRFPHGFYAVAAVLDGKFPIQSAAEFKSTLRQAIRNHSGWPPFPVIDHDVYRPRYVDGAIEAWFGLDKQGNLSKPSRSDFWRAAPEGMFYTRRGFDEDGRFRGVEPGKTFDITTATWRLGELLLQIHYISVAMGAGGASVQIRSKWSGLSSRKLVSIGNPNRSISSGYIAHQDTHDATITTTVEALSNALPEIVFNFLEPLYVLFDFFQLPRRLVEEELRNLRHSQF